MRSASQEKAAEPIQGMLQNGMETRAVLFDKSDRQTVLGPFEGVLSKDYASLDRPILYTSLKISKRTGGIETVVSEPVLWTRRPPDE